MILSDVSVKRPVFAAVISLLLLAFGALSFMELPLREYPDISAPVVSISTSYPGASAEVVAAATIGAADMAGLPVSTTHVLSSGVAGTMVANGSGLQWATVRNLLLAWVLTLPVAITLSATLYYVFATVF